MITCGLTVYMNVRKSNQASQLPRMLADSKRPNRVHLRCGLPFRLWMLLTPPYGDAISIGYRQETFHLKRTFTSLTTHTLGRT